MIVSFSKILKNKSVINASWMICSKVIQAVLAIIITAFSARYLGPSNYGLLSYAQSVVAFFAPFSLLGLTNTLIQEFVDNPSEEGTILGSSLVGSFASSILCVIGCFVFSLIANGNQREIIIVCSLYSIVLLSQSLTLIGYWFSAKLLSKYVAISSFIVYILISIYKIFLLVCGKSLYWFAIANSIDFLLLFLLLYYFYNKNGGQPLKFSLPTLKDLFSRSKYYILANLMTAIVSQTDRVMIQNLMNEAETGYYSAAFTACTSFSFIYGSIIDSLKPYVLRSRQSNIKLFEKKIGFLFSIVVYLALFEGLAFFIFAKPIILLLYGNDFSPSINAVRILIFYVLFAEIGVVKNVWILAVGKQKYLLLINSVSAISNIILNFLLIPRFGIYGAAFASAATQLLCNTVLLLFISELRPVLLILLKSLNPLVILNGVKQKYE